MKIVNKLQQIILIVFVLLLNNVPAQTIKIDGIFYREKPAHLKSGDTADKTATGESVSDDSLTIIKQDFLINSLDGEYGSEQSNISSAVDSSGNFALTWIDWRNGLKDIYVQFFNSAGVKTGSNIKVNDYPVNGNNSPFVAANKKGDFIVAWEQTMTSLMAQKFTSGGIKTGGNFGLNSYSYYIGEPCLAIDSDGSFMAMWFAENNGYYNTFVRFFDNDASPKSEEFQVTDNEHNVSSIGQGRRAAVDGNGNYMIVWSSYAGKSKSGIYLQMLNREGGFINSAILVSNLNDDRDKYFPEVASTDDGHFFIVWQMDYLENSAGNGGRIYSSENIFTSEQLELGTSSGWDPISVASDRDSIFLVQYYAGKAQMITASGKTIGDITRIKFMESDSVTYYVPNVTDIVNGIFYSSMLFSEKSNEDVYTRRFDTNFNPAGTFDKVNDDTTSAWQNKPLVYFNSKGSSIVLWEDQRNGTHDLYGQVYDKEFNPVGVNFQVNKSAKEYWNLYSKAVSSMSDGTFVIAYSGSGDSDYGNIYLQKVSTDGKLSGYNILVKENYDSYQVELNINSNDVIFLSWYNYYYVFARKFNKNFEALSSEMTLAKGTWRYPYDVSIDANLNLFSVWAYSYYEFEDYNVYGIIYNSSGQPLTDTLIINLGTSAYNLSCAIDGKDYAIAGGGSSLNIWRGYLVNNSYVNIEMPYYYSVSDKPEIINFINSKLLLMFRSGYDIYGCFINDKREEVSTFKLHSYEFINSLDEYNSNYSSAVFDEKIFFAYERAGTGNTGFDIMGNVQQVNGLDFSDESYYSVVRDDYLYNNFPNPFNGKTIIPYKLLSPYHVKLTLYDVLGREVKVIVDEYQDKGFYEAELNAAGLSSGVYFYKLDAFKTYVKKLIVLK